MEGEGRDEGGGEGWRRRVKVKVWGGEGWKRIRRAEAEDGGGR